MIGLVYKHLKTDPSILAMRLRHAVFLFLLLTMAGKAVAMAICPPEPCKAALQRADLVATGRPIESGKLTEKERDDFKRANVSGTNALRSIPDLYTDFELHTVYKGQIQSKVRIYYFSDMSLGAPSSFPKNPGEAEQLLMAKNINGYLIPSYGRCSRCRADDPALAEIKARYDAIESLIKQYPDTLLFYVKKADLHEENNDFGGAVSVYERLFSTVPAARKEEAYVLNYGRALFLSGRYTDAVKTLEPLQLNPDARSLVQQSKLYLGGAGALSGQKLEMAGKDLSQVTISDADFSGANFSNARLGGVKFVNVILRNADFSNAQMQIDMSGSDLTGAKLEGARIHGKIVDSKFDNASLVKSEIELDAADGNSFRQADFTGAKFDAMECRPVRELKGSDFSGAKFVDATVGGLAQSNTAGADFTRTNFYTHKCISQNQGLDLSGKSFDNAKFDLGNYSGGSFKGASLRNASFSGDDLTGADFSGADLTGASFSTSRYSGPVKLLGADFTDAKIDGVDWSGALFDCKTRFPPGFKPEQFQMNIKDRSCALGNIKDPGVVDYDKDWLNRGYMSVCNGDFHADCIYGFLASYHVKQQNWSFEKGLAGLAESFLDAGYPNLAKVIALKTIGGIALSRRSLETQYFSTWLPLMKKIEEAQSGGGVRASGASRPKVASLLAKGDKNAAYALAEAAQESADAGDFDDALSYAREIGSDEYNREVLGWSDGSVLRGESAYGKKQQTFAASMAIALERQRHGQDATADINALIEAMQRKPEGHDQRAFAAAAMMAGMNSERPELLAAAYAATNRIDEAWKIYKNMPAGNDPARKLAVLSSIAGYYAQYPGKSGVQSVVDELKSFAVERWPQQGDMILVGIEIGIHQSIFDILGTLKSGTGIEAILSLTEAYTNENLKTRARLYAAEAFVKAGDIEKAFTYFEKCRAAISDAEPPSPGRRVPEFVIMLTPDAGKTARTPDIIMKDQDFGRFIFAVAVSTASKEEKERALKAGLGLLEAGKAGSPVFRAQMAVATAAIAKDKDSGEKMKDAEYGVTPSFFADLLHQAGFHEAEEQLIKIAWASADAPPAIGIERLGFSTGYQDWRRGGQLTVLAGMLAADGHFDEASQVARSIGNPSAVQRIGGTDYATYFASQKALYNVAFSALQQHRQDVANGIVREIQYRPYQAAMYFALARAALADKREEEARKMYDSGYDMAASFGDAMGAPLLDPDGLALDALTDRAAAETGLGLTQRYNQTLSYAKLAAGLAVNDVQRGKTSLVVDRITQMASGAEAVQKPGMEDFIKSLDIRDDLNSTSVVAEMAEKYLRAGDKERARAIAMYGFRKIDDYPQASGKVIILLPYASIIARTEPRMSEDSQIKLEAILREVYSNTPGGKVNPSVENVDLVAEGEVAYKEMKRRMALDEAPQSVMTPSQTPAEPASAVPGTAGQQARTEVPRAMASARSPNPLSWDLQGTDTRFLITPRSVLDGSDTKTFRIRNSGAVPERIPFLAVVNRSGMLKKTWKILRASTCLTQVIGPGADCTVVLQAKPDMDGQIAGFLVMRQNYPVELDAATLVLTGYARGISGKLPEGVIGNGDRCPAAGEPAEIATSPADTYAIDGYFNPLYGEDKAKLKLVTAECRHWEAGKEDELRCNDPGNGRRTATMHEYHSQEANGPWGQTRVVERGIFASVLCREGLIDQVNWSW